MAAVLLYAYASGVYSARRMAKARVERTDFMMIVALDPLDFRTISEARTYGHVPELDQPHLGGQPQHLTNSPAPESVHQRLEGWMARAKGRAPRALWPTIYLCPRTRPRLAPLSCDWQRFINSGKQSLVHSS